MRVGPLLTTAMWWGLPKYGWQFGAYRTAKGGVCIVAGVASFTFRIECA